MSNLAKLEIIEKEVKAYMTSCKCPACGGSIEKDVSGGVVLTSYPEQKRYACIKCNEEYTIFQHEWPNIEFR